MKSHFPFISKATNKVNRELAAIGSKLVVRARTTDSVGMRVEARLGFGSYHFVYTTLITESALDKAITEVLSRWGVERLALQRSEATATNLDVNGWMNRQTTPVAVADWKAQPEEVLEQLNHQLDVLDANCYLRLFETAGQPRKLRAYPKTRNVGECLYREIYIEDSSVANILDGASIVIKRYGMRITHCPIVASDDFIWVIKRLSKSCR